MAALYSITTRATGVLLTASVFNADHQNHIDNCEPQVFDDYSATATEMRLNTDPGELGSESLPTSMAGELERLRFVIKELKTHVSDTGSPPAHWYSSCTVIHPEVHALSTGIILPRGTETVPSGWLLCNGAAVSRTTFATLFAIIGTTFGAGDGSTTFNVPDIRGRAPLGTGQGAGLTNRVIAGTGGFETVSLTGAQVGPHSHGVTTTPHTHAASNSSTDGVHNHDIIPAGSPSAGTTQLTGLLANLSSDVVSGTSALSAGDHTHPDATSSSVASGAITTSTGSGTAHNSMAPFLVHPFMIKT